VIVAVPWSGRINPSSIRSVVDLPAPFGPRKRVTVPGATLNVCSSTARTGPKDFRQAPDVDLGARHETTGRVARPRMCGEAGDG
jgi:hypothetical protein